MKTIFCSLFIVSILICTSVIAEEITEIDTTKNNTVQIDTTNNIKTKIDTTLYKKTSLLESSAPVTDSTNFEKHLYQNPTKALFKSMVLPGWGQYGNKKKLKALIFVSIDIWMISKALSHKKKANDLWNKYDSFDDIATRNTYYELYNSERNLRNKFTWYAVITSFFAMFDAYVDAHLSGFPNVKEQKLTLDFIPRESSETYVSLTWHF